MNLEPQSKTTIKGFQFKKFNKSITNYYIHDRLAQALLKIIPLNLKSIIISFISLIAILLSYIIISLSQISRFTFLIQAIFIFLYQILDNINQKQAIRRGQSSILTIFIDHICDSISCSLIALTMGRLLQFSNIEIWFILLIFSIIPYYLQHLRWYYSDKLQLAKINPVDEGLLILQTICWISVFTGVQFYKKHIFGLIQVNNFLLLIFSIICLVYIVMSIKSIMYHNNNPHEYSLKNVFLAFIISYIFLETAILNPNLLRQNIIQNLLGYSFILVNTVTIGRLIIDLGAMQKFNQLSIDNLILTVSAIIFCSISYINDGNIESKIGLGKFFSGILFVLSLVYSLIFIIKTYRNLNQILDE